MKLSRLERFLRLFTDVRAGEGATALLLFANVFLVLCAYYFIKPLREGWLSVSALGGLADREMKAYTAFAQSLLLIPIVSGYGRLATGVARLRLITGATVLCMVVQVAFYFWNPNGALSAIPGSGIAFYLWVSIFGVFVVAQFWTFAADVYNDERGRRLMPMIAIGATGGAAFGASIVAKFVKSAQFGPELFLLAGLLPLAGSIALTRVVDRREDPGAPQQVAEPPGPDPDHDHGNAIRMIFSTRFLIATAGITLLLSWVNTNGENLLFGAITSATKAEAAEMGLVDPAAIKQFTSEAIAAFYGNFFTWVNLCALLLQGLVASRLLKYGGFGTIVLMMPLISLMAYSAMAIVPILMVIKVMKIAENSTDYSINNTARHVLWLPVDKEMKFKGKPTIDTLFVRLGDGLAAATILVGTRVFALSTQAYLYLTVLLVLAWIASAIVLAQEHRELAQTSPQGEPA